MLGIVLGCYVFGDSLTSPAYSWANQLIRDGHNLQVNAVPARKLVDLVIPPDVRKTSEINCAIVHLGSNDAPGGDVAGFTQHYIDIVSQLEQGGLRVYCVLPPRNDAWPVEWARIATQAACADVLDVETGFYLDGLHPSAFGHMLHGYGILSEIQRLNAWK